MNISEGRRNVGEYTSEFEMLLGSLKTQDESTWMNAYIWGLQPYLARAVALKYPTMISQASGHAETTELAIRASKRPDTGAAGQVVTQQTNSSGSRGGAQSGQKEFAHARGEK